MLGGGEEQRTLSSIGGGRVAGGGADPLGPPGSRGSGSHAEVDEWHFDSVPDG